MIPDRSLPRTFVRGALSVVFTTVLRAATLWAQGAPRHARLHGTAEAPAPRHASLARLTETTLDGAQTPNAFAAGDSVEVEYSVKGEWLPARVTDVVNDGYAYLVNVVPYDDGQSISAQIHYSRVRARRAADVTSRPSASGTVAAASSLPQVGITPQASAASAASAWAAAVTPSSECPRRSLCEATTASVTQQGSAEAGTAVPLENPPAAAPAPAATLGAPATAPSPVATPRAPATAPAPAATPPAFTATPRARGAPPTAPPPEP